MPQLKKIGFRVACNPKTHVKTMYYISEDSRLTMNRISDEEYNAFMREHPTGKLDKSSGELLAEMIRERRLGTQSVQRYNQNEQSKKIENKARAELKSKLPAPTAENKTITSRPLEQLQLDNDKKARSKNGNKSIVGDKTPTYTPPKEEKPKRLSKKERKKIEREQKKREKEKKHAVNRGRTQDDSNSGAVVSYGANGSRKVKVKKPKDKKVKEPSLFKGCETVDDAQKKYSDWAYQQSMQQFCKDKGIEYVQGETDDLYIEEQKENPDMFYNGTYYTGARQDLRDKLIKNESGLENFKINKKVRGSLGFGKGSGKTKKGVDKQLDAANEGSNSAKENRKSARKEVQDSVNKTWKKTKRSSYDGWMRGRKNFVNQRKRLQKKSQNALDKANTFGKTMTHDPAKLFESGIDKYIERHPDSMKAKYMKEKQLNGTEIIDALTGKYNKDDRCRKDIEALLADIDKANKDPSLRQKKYTDDYFNEKIEIINKTYGLSIPPYSEDTAQALRDTIEGNKQYQIKKNIKHLATLMMDAQMQSYLDMNIQSVLDQYNERFGTNWSDTPELRDKIRQVIRGTYTVAFNQDVLMNQMQKKTEDELKRFLQKKVDDRIFNSKTWYKFMHLDEDAGDVYRKKLGGDKINKLQDKLESWTNLSDVDFTLRLTEDLTDQLNNRVKFLGNAGGSLNKIDKKMGKFGLNLGLGDQFTDLEKNFALNIASPVEDQLKKSMTSTLKNITKITDTVKNFQKQIQSIQNKARDLVRKWESTAMDMVKAQEKVIVNNIMKSVKIDYKGAVGSFKI